MTQKTIALASAVGILACIDPDIYAIGDYQSAWIPLSNFQEVMAVVAIGDINAGGTVDVKIEQATSDAGADAKDVDGAALAQITDAASDDNTQGIINLWAEDLDAENDYTHIRISMSVLGAAADATALLLGCSPRFGPVDQHDADSVSQIVIVGTT